jgi:N-methylhydantoinase B
MDAITLEIIEGTIESAITEIEAAIERTAMSTMIREQHDFRAAIYDAKGRAISRVSFAATIDPIYRKFGTDNFDPGDVVMYNDVYMSEGGITHLPDICVNLPVFFEGQLLAWVQCFGHVEDIGGLAVGSMAALATSVFQEGLMIPPVKLYEGGRLNHALYELILRNSRYPDSLRGDLDAEIAGCRLGVTRVTDLFRRYSPTVVVEAFDRLLDRCERGLRETLLPQIPDGTYKFEDFIGFDGVVQDRRYKVSMSMTKDADGLALNFEGTSPQAVGPVNFAATPKFYAKLLGAAFRPFVPGLVLNEGVSRIFRMEEPPAGSLLNPTFPAPIAHRTVTMARVLDTFQGIMAQALPGRVSGAMDTITLFTIHGNSSDGQPFFFREIVGAGSGGRDHSDGLDAVDMVPESKNVPAEFTEMVYPLAIDRIALRQNSGGPGKFRGGHGYIKDVRILTEEALVSIRTPRGDFANWGVEGGFAGSTAHLVVNPGTAREIYLPSLVQDYRVKCGDVIRVMTSGGGGWGDPLEREPSLVSADVMGGTVSVESAKDDYGVVFAAESGVVEIDATRAQRVDMMRRKGARLRFDRGEFARRLRAEGSISYAE